MVKLKLKLFVINLIFLNIFLNCCENDKIINSYFKYYDGLESALQAFGIEKSNIKEFFQLSELPGILSIITLDDQKIWFNINTKKLLIH